MADIGSILFVDLLRMTAYPGSPFTGNIIQDLIMFFFIPSLILIAFFWVIVTRVPFIGTHRGLKILFALALYFFMIFQGLYALVASSVAFYLIILIIAGVFWFIGGHGHGNQSSGGGGAGHAYPGRGYPGGERSVRDLQREISMQQKLVGDFQREYRSLPTAEKGRVLSDLLQQERELERMLIELSLRSPSGKLDAQIREVQNRMKGYR